MSPTVLEEIQHFKSLRPEELDELFTEILADEDLRNDLLDTAIALQTKASKSKSATIAELTMQSDSQIDFRTLCGILPNNGIHLTIEQINEVISTMGELDDRN
ncbi:MAG: hypothetical protein FJY65_09310 [Calditrichaeota bacterium]|nr:hypothetical protein [Calditrichota bacterium]